VTSVTQSWVDSAVNKQRWLLYKRNSVPKSCSPVGGCYSLARNQWRMVDAIQSVVPSAHTKL